MASNIEMRIVRLEALIAAQAALIRSLQITLAATAAGINQAQGIQDQWNSGSGGGGIYVCGTPGGGPWPSGTFPTGAPGSFTADVYKVTGTSFVVASLGATIVNPYPSSPVNGRVSTVSPNADGTYTIISQSCT